MIVLRHLFNAIWPTFTPFEKALFTQMEKCLTSDEVEVLRSQLSEINFVQRHRGNEEICMYRAVNFSISQERTMHFPSSGEKLLCQCKVNVEDTSLKLKVWLVDGQIFSLEFNDETIAFSQCENVTLTPM